MSNEMTRGPLDGYTRDAVAEMNQRVDQFHAERRAEELARQRAEAQKLVDKFQAERAASMATAADQVNDALLAGRKAEARAQWLLQGKSETSFESAWPNIRRALAERLLEEQKDAMRRANPDRYQF